jgi:hypothetical protein
MICSGPFVDVRYRTVKTANYVSAAREFAFLKSARTNLIRIVCLSFFSNEVGDLDRR